MTPKYINHHQLHEYVPFPELGSGSQFHAFDTHDGRVLKIPLTKEETAVAIARRRHNMNPLSAEEAASVETRIHTLVNGKGRIPAMVNHPLHASKDFLALMGNPKIITTDSVLPEDTPEKQWGAGRVVYTQDKVTMVGDLLDSLAQLRSLGESDLARVRQLIELYIQQTYKMWEYGYSDYVFKLGDTGIDERGKFVLVDIGEYSSDPEFVLRALSDQRWLHAIISTKIDFPQIPPQLHSYYQKTMTEAFSVENFKKYWRKKHICDDCKSSDKTIEAFIAAKTSEIDYVDRW